MDLSNRGFALLSTYGRVDTRVPMFFAAAKATGMSIPGYVVVDAPDYAANAEAYDALDLPENWSVHVVKGGSLAEATRQALADLMDDTTEYVVWLADDLVPETPGWDLRVLEALTPYGFVSTNDGLLAPKKANGATAWGGDLLRTVGYMWPEGAKHFYIDDLWERIGAQTGCWRVLMDVMVRHAHVSTTGMNDATVARTNRYWTEDEKAFQRWVRFEETKVADRVLKLMAEHGVPTIRPDLSGMSIMIAVPCGSGKLDLPFTRSLMATLDLLRHYGAVARFVDLSGCSDIALARNKLFGSFLRSPDTHMVCIDDDMVWNPHDVVRLLLANEPFVAVAGPRKVFPPSFAVNVSDDFGNPIPVTQDPRTGFLEVTGIGAAFMVLTHEFAERMASAYEDLQFVAGDGRTEYGVFNPMVVNRRYLSEDYAMCHRWRLIGGRILVCPDVSLGHIGNHTWEGSWWSQLVAKMAEEQAA